MKIWGNLSFQSTCIVYSCLGDLALANIQVPDSATRVLPLLTSSSCISLRCWFDSALGLADFSALPPQSRPGSTALNRAANHRYRM